MKTIVRVSILSGLFLISLALLICSQLNAQTIISIDSSADNSIVMKIQSDDLNENPQRFILIIDNEPDSNQLSEQDVLALLDNRQNSFIRPVVYCKTSKEIAINNQDKSLMNYLMSKTIVEDIEEEDEIEMEEWMFNSENWIKN